MASATTRLGQPEVKHDGTQRLPRLVGKGRTLKMILTGDPVTAEEAHRIGLVNRVVPQESLKLQLEY